MPDAFDLIQIQVQGHCPDSKLFGIPMGWVAKDSVYFNSDLCRFDFSKKVISIESNKQSKSVGEIVCCKGSTLTPFIGIVSIREFKLTTTKGGFLGSELNLNLSTAKEQMDRKISYDTNEIVFGDHFTVNMDVHRKTMNLNVKSNHIEVAMITTTIIHKFKMDYLDSGVGG